MLALATLSLCPTATHAQAPQPALSVENLGLDCLTVHSLRRRIHSYLRHPPSQNLAVRVHGHPDALAFTIWRARERVAERRFQHLQGDCAARRDTLALTLALALEELGQGDAEPARADTALAPPLLAAALAAPPPAEAGASTAQPSAALPETPAAADGLRARPSATARTTEQTNTELPHATLVSEPTDTERSDRMQVASRRRGVDEPDVPPGLHAGARVLVGVLPRAAGVLAAGLELPLMAAGTLQLTGLVGPAQRSELAGGWLTTSLYGAEAVGCWLTRADAWRVGACGGLAAAGVHARGAGFTESASRLRAWVAALGRLSLRWFVTPIASLELAASAHLALLRPQWRVLGASAADAVSSPLGGALGVDLCVSLP